MKRIVNIILVLALLLTGMYLVAAAADASNAAAQIGTEYYASFAEALTAYPGDDSVIILHADVSAPFTMEDDLHIDLAGHSITAQITHTAGTLYIMDSNTDDYTVDDGKGYGTVPYSTNVVAAEGYLLHTENAVASAHAYDVRLTSVAQRASAVGMYFGSTFMGDEIVKSKVSEFGVSLRVGKAPDAAYIQADTGLKTHTRLLQDSWVVGANADDFYGTVVQNVMLPGNGDAMNSHNANIPVFGNSYIKLADGSFLFGSAYSYSLKELTELSDDMTLTDDQLGYLTEMYGKYRSVMADWDIPQIKEAFHANSYADRTASFVGDSITYGIKVTNGEQYWNHLKTNLELGAVTNHGVSGSCYSTYNDRGHNYQPLIDRYQNIAGTDLIFIFMGTNDFSHETPLGTTADTTDISLCGAMNIVLNGLKEAHPDSKIVLLTPIQRYDMTTNDIGLTVEDYVNTIKTVGAYHDIPVLDLYTPSLTRLPAEYFADKVHPTAEGHVILADMIQTLLEENKSAILG